MTDCDTCGDQTDKKEAVVMSLGAGLDHSSAYVECPLCVVDRVEDIEHGPKSVSIKPLIRDLSPRLSPGLGSMTTVWSDGPSYRIREWRRGGPA